jgi:uncharacterized protein
MKILPELVAFEWDDGNIRKNLLKHKVTAQEAEEVFLNQPFIVSYDLAHSDAAEHRYLGLGHTSTGRLLFVAFTIRDTKVRVISIRDITSRERINYEAAQ